MESTEPNEQQQPCFNFCANHEAPDFINTPGMLTPCSILRTKYIHDLTSYKRSEGCFAELNDQQMSQKVVHFKQSLELCGCGVKDSTMAAKYRQMANNAFQLRNIELALKYGTDSIRYAPSDTSKSFELSLGYENRSFAYLLLGEWENALADVKDAYATGQKGVESTVKLELCACECLIELGRLQEAKVRLDLVADPKDVQIAIFNRLQQLRAQLSRRHHNLCLVKLSHHPTTRPWSLRS